QLFAHVDDPAVQALLLAKFNQASELGITMSMVPDSQLAYRFSGEKKEALLTGLGNLLENAIEAVKNQTDASREVTIFFTDIGKDVVAEVDDSGPGVGQKVAAHIFMQD